MNDDLIPKLKEITVDPFKLILDPNNPRLITKDDDRRDPDSAIDFSPETQKRMSHANYKIDEIKKSIRENGWLPVDYIFVRKIGDTGRYLVLEGNRRVTAIRSLLEDDDTDLSEGLRTSLEQIQVMEIVDDLPEDQIRKKITYLLGVRHHGALKKWTPFAQAENIYQRYMEELSEASFSWNADVAEQVANALSIDATKDVKERLRVYVAMKQLADTEVLKQAVEADPKAGMKDRYYSVCQEVTSNPKKYGSYIKQDQGDFQLDDEAVDRMINLCHFDQPSRRDAPISNPQEWRKLKEILNDSNEIEREKNLQRIEVDKEKPSDVWAERSVQLQKLQWDQWLNKVHTILKRVTFDDLDAQGAPAVAKRLALVIDTLDSAKN